MSKTDENDLPKFFRVKQSKPAPRVADIPGTVHQQLKACGLDQRVKPGQTVAITAGSRGVHGILQITRAIVDYCKSIGAEPFVVPAMGSHGGATAEGQLGVLAEYGITPESLGCPIKSNMETVIVCQAKEGFPVHFDRNAFDADHVIVANRVKPHTRFAGAIESGMMKMMLIGLGKNEGAICYHRVIMSYSFDQIVRSVAREVIARCNVVAGLAILEDANDETAEIVGVAPNEIETVEPVLLKRAKSYLPSLPFDHADFLIVDELGKNISGSGMDTNVIGRKFNDRAAMPDESPKVKNIYVRSLTAATQGNAAGIGIAEMCHRRVIDQMDLKKTRINCTTAAHIAGAMIPVVYETDLEAIQTGIGFAGWLDRGDVASMWIKNTLALNDVACSQVFWKEAQTRSDLEILSEPESLSFDADGQLLPLGSAKTNARQVAAH